MPERGQLSLTTVRALTGTCYRSNLTRSGALGREKKVKRKTGLDSGLNFGLVSGLDFYRLILILASKIIKWS